MGLQCVNIEANVGVRLVIGCDAHTSRDSPRAAPRHVIQQSQIQKLSQRGPMEVFVPHALRLGDQGRPRVAHVSTSIN